MDASAGADSGCVLRQLPVPAFHDWLFVISQYRQALLSTQPGTLSAWWHVLPSHSAGQHSPASTASERGEGAGRGGTRPLCVEWQHRSWGRTPQDTGTYMEHRTAHHLYVFLELTQTITSTVFLKPTYSSYITTLILMLL